MTVKFRKSLLAGGHGDSSGDDRRYSPEKRQGRSQWHLFGASFCDACGMYVGCVWALFLDVCGLYVDRFLGCMWIVCGLCVGGLVTIKKNHVFEETREKACIFQLLFVFSGFR